MKRFFDFAVSFVAAIVLLLPALVVALVVKLTSAGPALYWSDRVGQGNRIFSMPKFRTMLPETPVVATHELGNARSYITPVGRFLRKSSLDEIPQLWCILRGDMSLVGPRPALFNQTDLIALRTESGVNALIPGLTGWAQVNGRDELSIPEKVEFDSEYLKRRSFIFDLKILLITFTAIVNPRSIAH